MLIFILNNQNITILYILFDINIVLGFEVILNNSPLNILYHISPIKSTIKTNYQEIFFIFF